MCMHLVMNFFVYKAKLTELQEEIHNGSPVITMETHTPLKNRLTVSENLEDLNN